MYEHTEWNALCDKSRFKNNIIETNVLSQTTHVFASNIPFVAEVYCFSTRVPIDSAKSELQCQLGKLQCSYNSSLFCCSCFCCCCFSIPFSSFSGYLSLFFGQRTIRMQFNHWLLSLYCCQRQQHPHQHQHQRQ